MKLFTNHKKNEMNENEHIQLMNNNLNKIFNLYHNCKKLMLKPTVNTMKIIFHSLIGKVWTSEESKIEDECEGLLEVLINDIENYEIEMDSELTFISMEAIWMIENDEIKIKNIMDNWYDKHKESCWNEKGDILDLSCIPNMCEESLTIVLRYIMEKEIDFNDKCQEIMLKHKSQLEIIEEELKQLNMIESLKLKLKA